MKNYPRQLATIIVIVGIFLLAVSGNTALAARGETVEITSPSEGESVSGLVTATGTVDFMDFMKYEVFLKTGNQLMWAATVFAPVINGNLAYLDTRTYPDGLYQLIIRTVKTDSNYNEYPGPTFAIENNLGAPLPYPEVESSPLYPPEAGASARVRNCSGDNLSFTYGSPQGFCSADDLWIPYKEQNSPTCPYVDLLLIPDCEYRGSANGQGQTKGATYSFVAEHGKIYEIIYSGGQQIYIAEIEGDERASTDTGGLALDDSTRYQEMSTPEAVAAGADEAAKPTVAAPVTPDAAQDETILPVSGAGRETNTPFMVAAIGLILFLLVAGMVAVMRKRGHSAAN
ncbi:MAG: hypothetical protein JW953_12555 [Anaerolineae bacterium]|nr:hypothetical protein [Anaerolineae bacterium]